MRLTAGGDGVAAAAPAAAATGVTVKARLYAPGPVEVPPAVLAAMALPVVHHRTPAFRELFMRVRARLADVFLDPGGDVVVVTGSGSAAFEAMLLACVPLSGDVIALHDGRFGERWAALARRYGYSVTDMATAPGTAFDLDALDTLLAATPGLAAVTVVHSETSTGALHDVAAVARVVRARRPDALVLVDAVTSLAAAELRPKAWDLDGVVSGSQKGVMAPPGLGFAWLSERALATRPGLLPASYLDLRSERERQRDGQTSFTPATSLVAALDVALTLIAEQGLEARWRELARRNGALFAAGSAMGMSRLSGRPSPSLAAQLVPDGVSAPAVVRAMAARGVTVAGGEGDLRPRLLRPSLLGWADRYDAVVLAAALEDGMRAVGARVEPGVAVAAAIASLDAEAADEPDGGR